ncbi:MAG TPA: serine hydrolase [Dongiaceae bacterium]|nr:serine hydrolase [Dongiaceae bacterium]
MWRIILVLATLLTSLTTARAADDDPFPAVASSYILRVDGKTVWAHRPERRLSPASLTKVMTALLALEQEPLDRVVTVDGGAAAESGTRIGLRRGDRMTVGHLLAATLIFSANDACRALADHVGGDRKRFIALMNARAEKLGLKDTHFNDPCGHDQTRHYSSAHDLAILAEAALGNRTFRDLVSRQQMQIRTVDGKRRFNLRNKNHLLGRYSGAAGVKTGYTPAAGGCLIALAEREGTPVLLVMLHTRNRWHDAAAILDRAFLHAGKAPFANRSSSEMRENEDGNPGIDGEGLENDREDLE